MSGAMRNDILGVPFTTDDGRKVVRAKAHAALSAYVPYLVVPTLQSQTLDGVTTVTGDAVTAALNAVASVDRQWGVPQRDYESGDIAELQQGGPGKLNVDNTAGPILTTSYLKFIPGTSTILGQFDGADQTVNSVARSCEAMNSPTDTTIQVQFIPDAHVINT